MCGPRAKAELDRSKPESTDKAELDRSKHESTDKMGRRTALRVGVGAIAAAGLAGGLATPVAATHAETGGPRRVFDLTHRLTTDFPTFFGDDAAATRSPGFTFENDGFRSQNWTIQEHWGTHLDAPGHFGPEAWKVDEIPADKLVARLAVVDIKDKAAEDPNAVVEISDLRRYERRYGKIPWKGFVAMNSGWANKRGEGGDIYRGGAGFPDLNFPGFSLDAANWLIAKRNIVGIGVDTLSLDPGNSPDFAVHFGFLPQNRYGVENLAGVDDVPPAGMTVVVGAVPWQDGSGGPSRVIAFG